MPDPSDVASFTPADSPLTAADVMTSPEYLDLMKPEVTPGDTAVDFELPRLDSPNQRVRLSSFAGNQPVALIFGSYT